MCSTTHQNLNLIIIIIVNINFINLLFLISFTAGFLSSGSITKGLPPPPDDYDDDSIGGIPMDEGGGPDFGGCYGDDVEPHLPRESYIPALANNEQGQPSQVRCSLELYVHVHVRLYTLYIHVTLHVTICIKHP